MDQVVELDDIDCRILSILQHDAARSIQDIADEVGLTSNPCWRRIRRLERDGVIERRVAVVNAAAVGLGMTAFVTIRTDRHTSEWLSAFARAVQSIPEIVECHRMAGEVDYLLKVVVRDLAHYDDVYQRLIGTVPDLNDVASIFSMERLKQGGVVDPLAARS